MIKKLDQSSILNICVNQVIIDLATCVKELVENSLDAGSTKIEVYLKEYGKEGVEVVDNGCGISISNLETIAQKGATSKLRQFQDLESLDTFGFRGEALNAISVLSQLTITTRTENEEMAHRFQFNQDNTVKAKQLVPRERGTSIGLSDLFGNIPVRKQEFNKNIISQYNKLVNLITEYALISVHCQICLINQTSKKGREMILNSGPPMKNMLQKITQVFSKKISDMLVEIKFDFGEESRVIEGYVLNRQTSGSVQESKSIQKNMAYLFANTRPINSLKKMNSIFSDIYKRYNSSARYIYVLSMQIKKDAIDFNVSPDKREVFIKYENEFYTALRDNLTQLFEKLNSIQKVLMPTPLSNKRNDAHLHEDEEDEDQNEQSNTNYLLNKKSVDNKQITKQGKIPFQRLAQEAKQYDGNDSDGQDQSIQKFEDLLNASSSSKSSLKSKSLGAKSNIFDQEKVSNSIKKQQIIDEDDNVDPSELNNQQRKSNSSNIHQNQNSQYFKMRNSTHNSDYFNIAQERKKAYEEQLRNEQQNEDNLDDQQFKTNSKSEQSSSYKIKVWGAPEKLIPKSNEEQPGTQQKEEKNINFSYFNDKLKQYKALKQQQGESQNEQQIGDSKFKIKEFTIPGISQQKIENTLRTQNQMQEEECEEDNYRDDKCCTQSHKQNSEELDSSFNSKRGEKETKLLKSSSNNKGFKVQEYNPNISLEEESGDMENVQQKKNYKQMEMKRDQEDSMYSNTTFKIKVKADDEIEELAEDLEDQLKNWENEDFKKEKFVELQIIGQFNKAFIVAYWVDKNQIFLIDQHASDEKTNYEKLLKDNVFQGQRLVKPIELNLTSQEADILDNNRDIFKKNGFQFQINYDENSGEATLKINQLPTSKHIQFDINDFDEIFQNLNNEETDIETFRPKKIQRVLASKACRSSIMIGTALNKQQMKQVLLNLSKLQSPWNCPHGRPTMVKTPPMNHLTQQVQVKKVYDL